MGSRILPKIAILSLNRLEQNVLSRNSSLEIKLFKRYVDDCFLFVDKASHSSNILDTFNSSHPTIKFEIEDADTNNSLSILDITIIINEEGALNTNFYEKEAKRGLFVHSLSHFSKQSKNAPINAEYHRIKNLCSSSSSENAAKLQIKKTLKNNGYNSEINQ